MELAGTTEQELKVSSLKLEVEYLQNFKVEQNISH